MTTVSRFRAMGSDAEVIVVGGRRDLVSRARRRIDELEARWSRFRPDSEVCALTQRAGEAVTVSADTLLLVERAIEAWHLTGGTFDATLLGDLIRIGYDRSFDELGGTPAPGSSELHAGCAGIQVDPQRRTVRLAPGTGFDAGGIGKGLAADLVVDELMAAGAAGACVNLGGDLRVTGSSPDDDTWTVGVDHAWSTEPIVLLGLRDGAVATSTTLRRRWELDGAPRHHLVDPLTGTSSSTDLTSATVIAPRGWVAEVLAKTVLLRVAAHPFDLVDGTGAEALAVDDRGHVSATPGLSAFLGDQPLPATIALRADHPT
jgi:thiamine biosynthesis lipoprotein